MMDSTLSARIRALVEFPALEDVGLAILRPVLEPDVPVRTLIEDRPDAFPFVLARTYNLPDGWGGHDHHIDRGTLAVHTLTDGIDADNDGAILSEAVRVTMRNAVRNRLEVAPGVWLHRAQMIMRPRRVPDWASATGPVQFADLPAGIFRYETLYRLTLRKA